VTATVRGVGIRSKKLGRPAVDPFARHCFGQRDLELHGVPTQR